MRCMILVCLCGGLQPQTLPQRAMRLIEGPVDGRDIRGWWLGGRDRHEGCFRRLVRWRLFSWTGKTPILDLSVGLEHDARTRVEQWVREQDDE